MNKYKVTATMYTKLVCELEANSLDEAWEIAKETDGGSFTVIGKSTMLKR